MRAILTVLTLILITVTFGCQNRNPLEGEWERYGDDFAGMRILIENHDGSFKAEIIQINDRIEGFEVGDIKWKNIKQINENQYEFEDLGKDVIAKGVYKGSYDPCRLELISNMEIRTRLFSKGTEIIGTETKWRRIVSPNR